MIHCNACVTDISLDDMLRKVLTNHHPDIRVDIIIDTSLFSELSKESLKKLYLEKVDLMTCSCYHVRS